MNNEDRYLQEAREQMDWLDHDYNMAVGENNSGSEVYYDPREQQIQGLAIRLKKRDEERDVIPRSEVRRVLDEHIALLKQFENLVGIHIAAAIVGELESTAKDLSIPLSQKGAQG